MATPIRLDYRAKPSFLAFMAQMWRPKRGFAGDGRLPAIEAHWRGQRSTPQELADFFTLSGMPPGGDLSILYPHTVSFPLLMAVLSHPAFPLPIWRVLQVRNRLTLHEAMVADAVLDFTVRTGERRVLAKGVEMDLHVQAESGSRIVFEGINTFYARGRFGAAEATAPASPAVTAARGAQWRMPGARRLRYCRLSGDFNPLHLGNGYARRQGFARAFAHPQRVIGQCLGHLGALGHAPLRLETWIKGPVYYASALALRADVESGRGVFALHVDGDQRPAIVGRYDHPKESA